MDNEQAQRICVLVAAYQAEATIGRCVRSALRQPEVAEIVVVDDASADETVAAARGADDGSGRLQVLRLSRNSGPSAARNAAIGASRSELLCVLDADDWLQDGRFSRMLAGPRDWDLLADDLLIADEKDPLNPTAKLLSLSSERRVSGDAFVQSNVTCRDRPRQELGYLKPLMRRSFLADHQLGYDERLRLGEDYVLYAEALIAGARFVTMPACGYVAVRHRRSLSHQHGAVELAALAEADRRLIAKAPGIAPEMRMALRRHHNAIAKERDYRRMLDAKARGDWSGVFVHGLRTPATAHYIADALWRAKLKP